MPGISSDDQQQSRSYPQGQDSIDPPPPYDIACLQTNQYNPEDTAQAQVCDHQYQPNGPYYDASAQTATRQQGVHHHIQFQLPSSSNGPSVGRGGAHSLTDGSAGGPPPVYSNHQLAHRDHGNIDGANASSHLEVCGAVAEENTRNQTKYAIALFDYEASEDNELSFPENAFISDIEFPDTDWWLGKYKERIGLFPANHVKLQVGRTTQGGTDSHLAIALFDYEAGEENEISFPEHAVIMITGFPDNDWWYGEYNGEYGLLPSKYVELTKEIMGTKRVR